MLTRVRAFLVFAGRGELSVVLAALLLSVAPARFGDALAKPAPKANVARTAPASSWTDADKWAWSKIENGLEADFNKREKCPPAPPADPEHQRDPAWNVPCRKLSGAFLTDILTKAPWREATPINGINIYNAKIEGNIDLEGSKLNRALWIDDSLIVDGIDLLRAKSESAIGVQGSLVTGVFDASSFHSESALLLRGSGFQDVDLRGAAVSEQISMNGASVSGTLDADGLQAGDLFLGSDEKRQADFKKDVILRSAKVAGEIDMTGASVSGTLNADGLQAGNLFLRSEEERQAEFKEDVILRSAKVAGQISMNGASVSGTLDADGLQAGDLFLRAEEERQADFKKDVILRSAKVAGEIDMTGASVSGTLNADGLQAGDFFLRSDEKRQADFRKDVILRSAKVAGQISMNGASVSGTLDADGLQADYLFMSSDASHEASFKDVILLRAKVAGQISMDGASVSGTLNADGLQGDQLLARHTKFGGAASITFAKMSSSLDLRGAELKSLDLRNTSVSGELRLGIAQHPVMWVGSRDNPSILDLREAHVASLVDTKDVWPTDGRLRLRLEGLKLDDLGGFEGDSGQEMRKRGGWWDQWARLDPEYSPAPYAQLVAVMKAAGDSDSADDIQFLGRERARGAICNKDAWSFNCGLQNVLGFAVGYGVGRFTFRALFWVLLISMISMTILKLSVPEAQGDRKSWLWCFGASFSRLLPGVDLSKEFADFFEGPFRPRFNDWQAGWFWFVRFAGFVLGAALLAAFAGLTHGP